MSAALRKKGSEERELISSKLGLPDSQPLVYFALCTGASSDPLVIFLSLTLLHDSAVSLSLKSKITFAYGGSRWMNARIINANLYFIF